MFGDLKLFLKKKGRAKCQSPRPRGNRLAKRRCGKHTLYQFGQLLTDSATSMGWLVGLVKSEWSSWFDLLDWACPHCKTHLDDQTDQTLAYLDMLLDSRSGQSGQPGHDCKYWLAFQAKLDERLDTMIR